MTWGIVRWKMHNLALMKRGDGSDDRLDIREDLGNVSLDNWLVCITFMSILFVYENMYVYAFSTDFSFNSLSALVLSVMYITDDVNCKAYISQDSDNDKSQWDICIVWTLSFQHTLISCMLHGLLLYFAALFPFSKFSLIHFSKD